MNNDIFWKILEKSDFKTIGHLCQINKTFYYNCKKYPRQIEKLNCKSVNVLIIQDDLLIRDFAAKNFFEFDKRSHDEIWENNFILASTIYDKFWVDLMYLLNRKYYKEAETLIICSKLPQINMGLFNEKEMVNMPSRLMKLLWQQLPSVEVAGYDNKEDFLQNYYIDAIENKTFREIIRKQLM
jgi:hypothetical protein